MVALLEGRYVKAQQRANEVDRTIFLQRANRVHSAEAEAGATTHQPQENRLCLVVHRVGGQNAVG